jgi:hypothetical protein
LRTRYPIKFALLSQFFSFLVIFRKAISAIRDKRNLHVYAASPLISTLALAALDRSNPNERCLILCEVVTVALQIYKVTCKNTVSHKKLMKSLSAFMPIPVEILQEGAESKSDIVIAPFSLSHDFSAYNVNNNKYVCLAFFSWFFSTI